MIDPYRMVFISLFSSILLFLLFFVYKFIFPKKNPSFPLILICLSILPLISLLRPGSYESGDLTLHSIRFLSFYNSLKAGILLPQWSHDLNSGFGYPLFIFVQTFPNHLASIFHFLGFSMINSIKIIFALSFIISGLSMYYFLLEFLPKRSSFAGAVLYLFAPYHLINMHFRANPGEVISSAILPICAIGIIKLNKNPNLKWLGIASISIGSLILAHPISIVLIPFLILYFLFLYFKNRNKHYFYYGLFSFIIGFGLSSYYIIPEILQSKFTHQAYYHAEVLFITLDKMLYSPWRLGFLYQGPFGELEFPLGYIQIILLIFSIYLLFKNKLDTKLRPTLAFYLICFFITVFFMLSISKPIWDIFFIFHNLQFSYRILILLTFLISVIGAISILKIKSNLLLGLFLFFSVFGTILNWGNRKVIPEITDKVLIQEIPNASKGIEGSAPSTPIWLNAKKPWEENVLNNKLEIVKGSAEIKTIKIMPTEHIYALKVNTKSDLRENTVYFPGWNLYINEKPHKIYPEIDRGVINFRLEPGLYYAKLKFEETNDRKIAQFITLFSIFLIIFIFFIEIYRKFNKFR